MDVEVINRFKRGDELAFGVIFETYYGALVHYASTILRNSDDAEDVVQAVFIRVWQGREGMDERVALRALLYKGVHNGCLNRLKHLKVRSVHAKEVMHTGEEAVQQDGVLSQELQEKIEQALDLLPEQCARIFKMSRFEQLKYQEIADKLGLSVKTVENQMGKALKIMRVQLQEYLPLLLIILSIRYGK